MKAISEALAAHIAGEVTSLATCWKLTLRSSTVMGFTDHDHDLEVSGITYAAATGFTPTAIANSDTLAVDNLDVEGMLSSGSIAENDVMAGLYDFAEIEVFQVNYNDLSQGILRLRCGWLGEVTLKNHQFVAEIRGLTQRLSQTVGELYSASCRAQLGDGRCKVDIEDHSVTGIVGAVVSRNAFRDPARSEAAGTFTFGIIRFTSGANTGISMEVKEYRPGELVMALPLPYVITAGDEYILSKGCDKTIATCAARFGNAVNFRGEPHVPGLDRMLETAGTRSDW